MKKHIFLFLALIISAPQVFAQVGVFPQALFLDNKNRTGDLKILNRTPEEKEISIELVYGYPGFDSLGNTVSFMGDTLPQAAFSAKPYIKFFPQKLMLKGNEEQVVKFMVGNTSNLADGTYTCRILVKSKKPAEVIDSTYSKDKVQARIDMNFILISALILEKGKKECIIEATEAFAYMDTSKVNFVVGFNKNGNSPFFGTANVKVKDAKGKVIADKKEITPIYYTSRKAFKFDKKSVPPGDYTIEVELTDEHKDIPKEFKIPFTPVKKSFTVKVQDQI